jgi:hypothetical protein
LDVGAPEDYCRALEAYLCRKNDGHLIRIVGPAFEKVCGWAERGVPITVAQRGIDRYFERYYAKGARRRPVRVEFCEPDVLDVFDDWRRAVGVASVPDEGAVAGSIPRTHVSLPAHLERVVARLIALRAGADRALDGIVDAIVAEVDAARASARSLRGRARLEFLKRLDELDATLMTAARAQLTGAGLEELRHEAEAELAPFRMRMPRDAFDKSVDACMDRLLRERLRIPTLSLE